MNEVPKLTPDHVPSPVVSLEQMAAVDQSPSVMRPIPGSRMFEIRDALAVYRRTHPDAAMFDASQGDGGSSLPGVPGEILDRAAKLQREHGTGYDKPFGTEMFRRAVVEDYWCLEQRTGWGPKNVIACQGGRDALEKAYRAMLFLGHGRLGDFLVVSRVPWISYNWGPYAVGANVLRAPGEEATAWELTPEGISACSELAGSLGDRRIGGVVITSPDNPTGRTVTAERQLELATSAFRTGVPFVIFDWIYHRVTDGEPHDINAFLEALDPADRARCIFLDGITKSLGASNVRNSHLLASEPVVGFIQSRASHAVIPSFHSQAVAVAAYRMGFKDAAGGIIEPTNRSRALLAELLERRGIRHILGKGYYAFIDVGQWLDRAGLADSAALGTILAERHGLAVVPGVYFSEFGRRWIRFSYALPPETTAGAAERLFEALDQL